MCFNCSDSSCSYIPHHLVEEGHPIRWWAGYLFTPRFMLWCRPVYLPLTQTLTQTTLGADGGIGAERSGKQLLP